jgi:hypothetical protein
MKLVHVAAGWAVTFIIVKALAPLMPETTCYDGWHSPSIGRMGACSHHGGVNRHNGLMLLVVGVSLGAGFLTSNLLSWRDSTTSSLSGTDKREPPFAVSSPPLGTNVRESPFTNEIQLITNAIKDRKKIEFLYKKPRELTYTKRTVRPIEFAKFSRKDGDSTLCVQGHCDLRKAIRSFALKRMKNLTVI